MGRRLFAAHLRTGLLLASAAACVALPAAAQTVEIVPTEPAPTSGDPEFDAILAAPDDPEVNFRFAQSEVAAGNLLSAGATLERLLIARPDWDAARLFYGAVLFRLDDLQSARREFETLRARPLTPAQATEVANYLRLIENRERGVTFGGQVSMGIGYDSNAEGALASSLDTGDVIAEPDDGLSMLLGASLNAAYRLAVARTAPSAYAGLSAISKTDVSGPDNEYQRGDLSLGLVSAPGAFTWRVGGLLRQTQIFGDRYVSEYGGRVELGRRLSTPVTLTGAVEILHQNFARQLVDAQVGVVDPRDGRRIEALAGATIRIGGRQTVAFDLGWEDKQARYGPFGYRGPRATAAFTALLGRGGYVSLFGTARQLDYKGIARILIDANTVPPTFFTVDRKDTRLYARAALGAPFSAFSLSGATGDYRERLRLEGAVSFASQGTRAPLVDYSTVGAELRLIYRFGR